MTQTLTPEQIRSIRGRFAVRQRARTDLFYLCKNILGYKDVDPEVHGPIIAKMPKFAGGNDELLTNGTFRYVPKQDLWSMEGSRKRLFLDPRGHLKTSVITQAGAIQWILNYPDIRILITTATGDLNTKIMTEIQGHFKYNDIFRAFFPEFCPLPKKVEAFGNQEAFTVPCRVNKAKREPTCSVSSVGKTIAGSHYEVLLCSDMVDKENIKTPGGLRDVIDHFKYMDPLLERHAASEGLPNHGWITVEGTRYDFGDLYGTIIDETARTAEGKGEWLISCRSAEVDQERQITLWPSRFPWKELKSMERNMGSVVYSSQMLNRPLGASGGLAKLEDLIGIWVPRERINTLIPKLNWHCTVDLASMEEKANGDYIVLTTAGFDPAGFMIVADIRRGHFTELQVIDQFYSIARMFPNLMDFKIEKEARWKTFEPFLRREQIRKGFLPPLIDIPRDTRQSKESRIIALQPWFQSKLIRFADDLPCRIDLIEEITRFPSRGVHDDILDTLADQMQNRNNGVSYDMMPNVEYDIPWGQPRPEDKFLGFDPLTKEAKFLYDSVGAGLEQNFYDSVTGV